MSSFFVRRLGAAVLLVAALAWVGCDGDDSVSATEPDTEGSAEYPDACPACADGDSVAAADLPHFSFFVTSLAALQELSGSPDGFGGDLRYGETGPGAGLRGADRICECIAERSMPGSSVKQWRAFLSITADENGQPVNAIDRIGAGPWYDRLGRLLAPTRADLVPHIRPQNGNAAIRDDLPNEDGVPNHRPDPNLPKVDNHHMLTGSDTDGTLYSTSATCGDWTTADGSSANGRPRCGFSWPRSSRASNSGSHWVSGLNAPGCAPGVGTEGKPPAGAITVGAGGGYGGFYCFALHP